MTICGLNSNEIKWLLKPTRIQAWDLYIPARKVQEWAKSQTGQVLVNDPMIKVIQTAASALQLGTSFNPWHGGMAFHTLNGINVSANVIREALKI